MKKHILIYFFIFMWVTWLVRKINEIAIKEKR
jgi:hypothetical protein